MFSVITAAEPQVLQRIKHALRYQQPQKRQAGPGAQSILLVKMSTGSVVDAGRSLEREAWTLLSSAHTPGVMLAPGPAACSLGLRAPGPFRLPWLHTLRLPRKAVFGS